MTKLVGDVNVPSGEVTWKTMEKLDDISFTVDVHHADAGFKNDFWKSGTLSIIDDHELEIFVNNRSLMFHRVVSDPKMIRNVLRAQFASTPMSSESLQEAFNTIKYLNSNLDSLEESFKATKENEEKLAELFQTLGSCNVDIEARDCIRSIWDLWLNHPMKEISNTFKEGLAHFKYNRLQMAILNFNKCIELDSTYAEAWNRRALCNYKTGHFNQALFDLERCLELEPRHFGALYSAVQICRHAVKDSAKELQFLRRLVEICPYDEQSKSRLTSLNNNVTTAATKKTKEL